MQSWKRLHNLRTSPILAHLKIVSEMTPSSPPWRFFENWTNFVSGGNSQFLFMFVTGPTSGADIWNNWHLEIQFILEQEINSIDCFISGELWEVCQLLLFSCIDTVVVIHAQRWVLRYCGIKLVMVLKMSQTIALLHWYNL